MMKKKDTDSSGDIERNEKGLRRTKNKSNNNTIELTISSSSIENNNEKPKRIRKRTKV